MTLGRVVLFSFFSRQSRPGLPALSTPALDFFCETHRQQHYMLTDTSEPASSYPMIGSASVGPRLVGPGMIGQPHVSPTPALTAIASLLLAILVVRD